MSHGNARLTFHGRRLLVDRVKDLEIPQSHVAKAMGVSRRCVAKWVKRFEREGEEGLHDRSSRPHSQPTRTPPDVEEQVLEAGEAALD